MTPRVPTPTDFNPAERDPRQFGYSSVQTAFYNVRDFLQLTTPLPYPRAIDSSHWTIENIKDWLLVAQSIALFYTKSTEGNYYTDLESQQGAVAAKAAGLIALFFHFFRRNLNGTAQFNFFKTKTAALINQIGGAKIVICDMETSDSVSNIVGNNNFKLFCNDAHAAGYKVGLYVNPAQWVSFGLGAWVNLYVDFYLLAHWQPGNNPTLPPGLDPTKLAMQQEGVLDLHSWIQPIPGLVPQMDANILLWTIAQMETFTGQTYTPGNPAPPVDPPPIGDDPPMTFTNPNELNIRKTAHNNLPKVGTLPDGSTIVALEVRFTDSNSAWVRFTPKPEWLTETVPEYWVAGIHDGQGPLLQFVSS